MENSIEIGPRVLLLDALVCLIEENRERYGVLLDGLEDLPLRELVERLGGAGRVHVSLVGIAEAEVHEAWAREHGFDELGFGIGATHAVEVRNSAEVAHDAVRLAVVGEAAERLHSLTERSYLHVDASEVLRTVARRRQEVAANEPQANLWRAIASPAVSAKLSLNEFLTFTAAVANSRDQLDAPRGSLPLLGLLRDPSLFRRPSTDAIAARLLENRAIVARFQQASDDDRQRAYLSLQNADALDRQPMDRAYNAFLRVRRGDYSAIEDLTLPEAIRLLTRKGSPPAPPQPPEPEGEPGDETTDLVGEDEEEPIEARTPAEGVTLLAAEGNLEAAGDLAEEIAKHLAEKGTETTEITVGGMEVTFDPDAPALHLARAFVTKERFGATVRAPLTLVDALSDLGALLESAQPFGDREITELQHYMERAGEVQAEFMGATHLADYLTKRELLLSHVDILATEPLLALVGLDQVHDAAREAVDAYVRLLSHIKERYAGLHQESPVGAALIAGRVLALDLVIVRGTTGEPEAAIVLPTNPLTLWKHLELASLLRQRAGNLSPDDRDLLISDLRDIPEPLLALLVPIDGEDSITMAQVGRVGSLPLYRPTAESTADVDEKTICMAAERLAMLYPPVKDHLRLALLDPESLAPTSRALRRLLRGKDAFGHVSVTVATTEGRRAPQADAILGELRTEGRVTILYVDGRRVPDIEAELAQRPVHLLAVAGQRERHVAFVSREATRLHPLAVPHQIVADRITQTVRIEPRSARPEADVGDPHPYAPYFDVVAALSNRRHQDPTQIERREARGLDFASLARHAQFCLAAGAGESRRNGELLYLAQGGPAADEVFTAHAGRIVSEIERLLSGWNYAPQREGLQELLKRLEELGGEGLFAAFSAKASGGLAHTKLREKLGLAVALDWYSRQAIAGHYLILSLDGPPAQSWLSRRVDTRRADLLGFRASPDGTVMADVIEVKSYEATGDNAAESPPADQLRSVARLLLQILGGAGDLLLDRRRELLRRQVYTDGFLARERPPSEWVHQLNDVLDGKLDVQVNLLLVELALDDPSEEERRIFYGSAEANDAVGRLPLQRIRLGEAAIQPLLAGLLARGGSPEGTLDRLPILQTSGTRDGELADAGDSRGTPVLPERRHDADGRTHEESAEQDGESQEAAPVPATDPLLHSGAISSEERDMLEATAKDLYRALQEFGVSANPVDHMEADVGPSLIRYKVRLRPGESISKLRRVAEELQRELALDKEPMAGNLAGTRFAYVDLPRKKPRTVPLQPILDRARAGDPSLGEVRPYSFPAGMTPDGHVVWLSIPELPHMLVAGETGAGKSVFLRTLIAGLAALNAPDRLQLILVDPKRTDFLFFKNLPHLHGQQVISEPETAIEALQVLVENEMERRTALLEDAMHLNIHSYNAENPEVFIPPILVVIDEFADLADVLGARGAQREVFDLSLRRLAQRSRSVGIHLVIATQRPTTDIVNGTIKANLPCKVSFRLGSNVDSRTILDEGGAEHLFGRGDMLLKRGGETVRLQGLYLDERDLRALVLTITEQF
jgi:hypothetical protein